MAQFLGNGKKFSMTSSRELDYSIRALIPCKGTVAFEMVDSDNLQVFRVFENYDAVKAFDALEAEDAKTEVERQNTLESMNTDQAEPAF